MDQTSSGARSTAFTDAARGLRDMAPIMVATAPFGIVIGTLASHAGLSFGDNAFMSAVIFAGASQFAALDLWAEPLPFFAILGSVIAVNLRHVLYSAAIGRKVDHWPPLARYVGLGLLTDPTYALAELKGARLSVGYYFGLAVPLYFSWLLLTSIGFLFGDLIRNPEAIGIDFVVIAYFIHILLGYRKRPNALAVVSASGVASVAAYLTAGPPWHFAAGAAAGLAVAVALAGRRAKT